MTKNTASELITTVKVLQYRPQPLFFVI